MNFKSITTKTFFLVLFFSIQSLTSLAGIVKGTVRDTASGKPLPGAIVKANDGGDGDVTDINGEYSFEVADGTYEITVKYIGYKTVTKKDVTVGAAGVTVDFQMETDSRMLGEVSVKVRRNMENERALQAVRQEANIAIENIGAKEMSTKGLSNVEEGVKQITGISIADAGQLIVRGLGDRYSTTTLNGLPIASPNPDNKLVPLDLFPSSTVQNITVSKVYDAAIFADYSGAHIDISTKGNVPDDFFNVSFNVGGAFNTLGKDFYMMDRDGTLLRTPSLDESIYNMQLSDFNEYVRSHNIFKTTFDVERRKALPQFGGNIGFGKNIAIKDQTLSILASLSASNGTQNVYDAFYKTLEASTGNAQSDFTYDQYTSSLQLAGLGSLGVTLREEDHLGYSFFYARNASDSYETRTGFDTDGYQLLGSNNVTHIYTLQNHQLNGLHHFGPLWELTWGGSFSKTSSEEPDRRQVMLLRNDDGTYSLFKRNRQETMRYYGDLTEKEWVANVAAKYKWTDKDYVRFGFSYKDKDRDYMGTRFFYNLKQLDPVITDICNMSPYLTQENVAAGIIDINRRMQSHDAYRAGNEIYAAYVTTDFYPLSSLLVNVGLRYELSKQWVEYAMEGFQKFSSRRDLDKHDIFPTLNLKYSVNEGNDLRLSLSRTVTRPSFIEMAPFLYQESYGSTQIRGNEDLKNGYNYNLDVRYEHFNREGDLFSVTAYFKHLDSPIERTQRLNGGATMYSFQNADQGMATGLEVELRKKILKDLRVGANVSYMYTNVKLPDGGAYTNKERSLQGASPILFNADVAYTPDFGRGRRLSLALLYNLQGRRIHAVGVQQLGDVHQEAVHTMNFNASYSFNDHISLGLKVNDLLNRALVFKQEIPKTGDEVEVERFKEGSSFEIGFTYRL